MNDLPPRSSPRTEEPSLERVRRAGKTGIRPSEVAAAGLWAEHRAAHEQRVAQQVEAFQARVAEHLRLLDAREPHPAPLVAAPVRPLASTPVPVPSPVLPSPPPAPAPAVRLPLVELRPALAGARPPLFLVHPASGQAEVYRALARHMAPDLPLYALEAPGLTGGFGAEAASLEALAVVYADAVQSLQPQGPYRLGGWSTGGVFAFEMARRLRVRREEIELLVLIDSHAPEPEHLASHEESLLFASFAREIAGMAGKNLPVSLGELRRMPSEDRLPWVLAAARRLEVLPDSVSPGEARRLWEVYRANRRAAETCRPERQHLRAVLFRATRQGHEADGKPSLGWARWITGRIEVVAVDGEHTDILREPAAEAVARGISERL